MIEPIEMIARNVADLYVKFAFWDAFYLGMICMLLLVLASSWIYMAILLVWRWVRNLVSRLRFERYITNSYDKIDYKLF